MEPFKIEFSESAAASVKHLPVAGRSAVMRYLQSIAKVAGAPESAELPAQRTAEVASFFVRFVVDQQARCVRVVSPLA